MFLRIRALGLCLVALLFALPVVSSALTADEIRAQIQEYREQIAQLQKQLQELRHAQEATSTPPWPLQSPRRICALLTHDVPFGSTSDLIRAVQEALAEDPSIYPTGLTTGYFGPLTQSALQRLHDRLVAQGFATTTLPFDERARIGPWLRALLMRYWCLREPLPVPPVLTCPIVPTTTPTESCAGTWERLKGFRDCHVGWRCIPPPSPTNQPPVISSFEGPTELRVNQVGTWAVSASDPENNELSYRILWGDESVQERLQSLAEPDTGGFTSTTTLTHAYGRAGHYTVLVLVRDSARNVAHAIAAVKVTSDAATIACTQEAKQCPDGSYVGRTGPNCEFKCPATPGPFPLPDDQALKDKVCPFLTKLNLIFAEGVNDAHVRSLQELLQAQGFLHVEPTGYFGPLTRDALQRWEQARVAIDLNAHTTVRPIVVLNDEKIKEILKVIRTWCEGHTVPPEVTPPTPTTGSSCVVHNPFCGDTVIPNGEVAHHSCCAVGTFQLCQNGVLTYASWNDIAGRPKHVTNGCGKDPSFFSQ